MTLWLLLTVAVFEPELYDDLFCDSGDANDEGAIPVRVVPFEDHTIARLREVEQLSSGVAAAQLGDELAILVGDYQWAGEMIGTADWSSALQFLEKSRSAPPSKRSLARVIRFFSA